MMTGRIHELLILRIRYRMLRYSYTEAVFRPHGQHYEFSAIRQYVRYGRPFLRLATILINGAEYFLYYVINVPT